MWELLGENSVASEAPNGLLAAPSRDLERGKMSAKIATVGAQVNAVISDK